MIAGCFDVQLGKRPEQRTEDRRMGMLTDAIRKATDARARGRFVRVNTDLSIATSDPPAPVQPHGVLGSMVLLEAGKKW